MSSIDTNREEMLTALAKVLSPRRYRTKFFIWHLTIRLTIFIKRGFDMVVSILMLVLLSPLFALTALCITAESKGPVFYSQTRVGANGRDFMFYKFRSMIVGANDMKAGLMKDNESKDGVLFKMKQDPRVTRVGRFIRKYSIDELPQLLNVLIGDMSLVGPRPATTDEVAQYTLEQRKRLHAMPGITCIWQVSGRSEIPFEKQVQLDIEYIKSTSILNDIIILLKTIPAVLAGKGAY